MKTVKAGAVTDHAELVQRLRSVYADWDVSKVLPLLPAAADAIDQLTRDKAAILDAAHAERDELRRTIERLTKELDEARAVVSACHEAIGESPTSDDGTLAEGIALHLSELRAALAFSEARLADIARQVRERCKIICAENYLPRGRHASECMAVDLGFGDAP